MADSSNGRLLTGMPQRYHPHSPAPPPTTRMHLRKSILKLSAREIESEMVCEERKESKRNNKTLVPFADGNSGQSQILSCDRLLNYRMR